MSELHLSIYSTSQAITFVLITPDDMNIILLCLTARILCLVLLKSLLLMEYRLIPYSMQRLGSSLWDSTDHRNYNAVNDFITEQISSGQPLPILGELLVQIVIRTAEERTMSIQEQVTVNYRKKFTFLTVKALNQGRRREQIYRKGQGQIHSQLHILNITILITSLKKGLG